MPAKPKVEIPTGDHVDEVSMVEYESTRGSSNKSRSKAGPTSFQDMMMGDDEDDEDDEGGAGQRVECNTH